MANSKPHSAISTVVALKPTVITPEVASTTETVAQAPAEVKKKQGSAYPLLLTFVAVFPLAMGFGAIRLKASSSSVKAQPAVHDQPRIAEKPAPVVITEDRRIGDRNFLARRYEVALQYYQSLGSSDSERLPAELLYRTALCQEGLGLWNEAQNRLRLVAESTDDPHLRAAAIFGQARNWIRLNEPECASSLLASLNFRTDLPKDLPAEISRDIAFLVPMIQASAATLPVRQANRCAPAQVSELWNSPLETALAWADQSNTDELSAADASIPENALDIRRTPPGKQSSAGIASDNQLIENQSVDVCCRQQPLGRIIQCLADVWGWDLELRCMSDSRPLERNVSFMAEEMPSRVLLTLLCTELQCQWTREGNRLVIDGTSHSGPASRRMLAQTLSSLVNRYPDHRLADFARFAMAEIAQSEGSISEAASLFASLAGPKSSPLALRAAGCSAVNYYRLGEFESACRQLKRVVDGAPESEMRSESIVLLGQLLLDRGEFQEAIFHLRRATEPNNSTDVRARASVLLGMAYLVQDKFPEAAEAVFARKPQLESPQVRNAASFVTAWARWKSLNGELRDRESTYLYRALIALKADSEWLGQTGHLLIGRAYFQLGFDDQMADLYSNMLTVGMTENISGEMIYSLADYELSNGRPDSAKELWWMLSSGSSKIQSNKSRFRLAEIALDEGQSKVCLEICEQLRANQGVARPNIQKLMGRAFELLGDDALAARCYAGQVNIPE